MTTRGPRSPGLPRRPACRATTRFGSARTDCGPRSRPRSRRCRGSEARLRWPSHSAGRSSTSISANRSSSPARSTAPAGGHDRDRASSATIDIPELVGLGEGYPDRYYGETAETMAVVLPLLLEAVGRAGADACGPGRGWREDGRRDRPSRRRPSARSTSPSTTSQRRWPGNRSTSSSGCRRSSRRPTSRSG